MVPELDLTPPAATVPPFSPVHFPPANFNVPRAVVVLVVPFLDWQFIVLAFEVVVAVVVVTAFTVCSTDTIVTIMLIVATNLAIPFSIFEL